MKTCSACGIAKPVTEYHRHKVRKDGLSGRCKPCNCAAMKRWREENPEKERAHLRKWRKENPEKHRLGIRRYNIRKRWGMTPEEYDSMVAQPCAVCGCMGAERNIDHDHATGEIRGVLCGHCNRALGGFKDDPKRLLAAVKYLEFA